MKDVNCGKLHFGKILDLNVQVSLLDNRAIWRYLTFALERSAGDNSWKGQTLYAP